MDRTLTTPFLQSTPFQAKISFRTPQSLLGNLRCITVHLPKHKFKNGLKILCEILAVQKNVLRKILLSHEF